MKTAPRTRSRPKKAPQTDKIEKLYNTIKLKPALVPRPLWGRSVCQVFGSSSKRWRTLRQQVIDSVNSRCLYCGTRYDKGMVCHEVWNYDNTTCLATLTAFSLACRDCDSVLHIGHTLVSSSDDERADHALDHLQKVSDISSKEAQDVVTYCMMQFSERPRTNWGIIISTDLIEEYPVLKDLKL